MSYLSYYILFGAVFLLGVVGYWIVTRVLRDPRQIYVEDTTKNEPPQGASSPHPGKA